MLQFNVYPNVTPVYVRINYSKLLGPQIGLIYNQDVKETNRHNTNTCHVDLAQNINHFN